MEAELETLLSFLDKGKQNFNQRVFDSWQMVETLMLTRLRSLRQLFREALTLAADTCCFRKNE